MRFFDFFAGIGGFRLGMEMAGHECVGHCEIDEFANKSYMAMHRPKESEVFFTDVRAINPSDMPECEVYCFGFPCQSFSIAGKRGGFGDTKQKGYSVRYGILSAFLFAWLESKRKGGKDDE